MSTESALEIYLCHHHIVLVFSSLNTTPYSKEKRGDTGKEQIMITGVHAMFYSSEAEALREFIRDKLEFSFTDTGGGWLIFDLPDAELGCHPADPNGKRGKSSGTHDISFTCDDIQETVSDLKSRGVDFLDNVFEEEYGFITHFKMPGDVKVQLYQPKYKRKSQKQDEKR